MPFLGADLRLDALMLDREAQLKRCYVGRLDSGCIISLVPGDDQVGWVAGPAALVQPIGQVRNQRDEV